MVLYLFSVSYLKWDSLIYAIEIAVARISMVKVDEMEFIFPGW